MFPAVDPCLPRACYWVAPQICWLSLREMNLFDTAFKAIKTVSALSTRIAGDKKADEKAVANAGNTQQINKPDVSAGVPHYNKGMILERRGSKGEAIDCYRQALKAAPDYFDAHANLARLLCEKEEWDQAINHCKAALKLRPNTARVHNNFATALYQKGKFAEAVDHCTTALRLDSDDSVVYQNLKEIFKHHPELEGTEVAANAKALFAQLADKNYMQGTYLLKDDKIAEAIQHWREAARFDPEWAELLNNLAWILATHPDEKIRNGREAIDLARKAVKLVGDKFPRFMDTLAAAYAECGNFAEARRVIEKTIPIVKANGPLELAEKLPERLKLYRDCQPLREAIVASKPADDFGGDPDKPFVPEPKLPGPLPPKG